jgi:hypothetical protein
MNVEDILQVLQERGAVLYVEAGRLRFRGPKRPPGDPLRTAIAKHRDELVALFSPTVSAFRPPGWSDRLGREVYEAGAQPGTWIETDASAALCIWCSEPLAEGDKLGCVAHRTPAVAAVYTATKMSVGVHESPEGAA